MIKTTLAYINKNFSVFFFKNPNALYYNIFNLLHKKLIAKGNNIDFEIKDFILKGYFKTNINSLHLSNLICEEIKKESVDENKPYHDFDINIKMREIIKNHINNTIRN